MLIHYRYHYDVFEKSTLLIGLGIWVEFIIGNNVLLPIKEKVKCTRVVFCLKTFIKIW